MSKHIGYLYFIVLHFIAITCHAQVKDSIPSNSGWLSLGGRSTFSVFGDDGAGMGTGGQFRIQFSNKVNSDWFADYITINVKNKVRSEYLHIGWSVLFYPFENQQKQKLFQPYVLAGHCFDYNKMTIVAQPSISKNRLGSAVQTGLGTHINLTNRFDVTLSCQYMIHLTKELKAEIGENFVSINEGRNATLQGHLLTTVSLNYKIFKLWKR